MRFPLLSSGLFVLGVCTTGCGSVAEAPTNDAGSADGGAGADGASASDSASSDGSTLDLDGAIGGDRLVAVHVPPGYVAGVPAPLVLMLHGYSATAAIEEGYLKFTAQSDARGFLYATPEGRADSMGNHYWNATDACCDFDATHVDDSTYLSNVIKQIEAQYSVDPKKVFLIGHSNGGFMSYRMACDHGDQIAAIASLAGAMYSDVTKCAAKQPVSILEIHGTADTTIAYGGGMIGVTPFPGATTTVSDWVTIDGCSATGDTSAPPLDLVTTLPGSETTITRYATGCMPGGGAELWTVAGGEHIPGLSATFTTDVIDFLYAHSKP
ncbi:MAG: PHB depolymerase family esterase [Polyangiaceae bacterium]